MVADQVQLQHTCTCQMVWCNCAYQHVGWVRAQGHTAGLRQDLHIYLLVQPHNRHSCWSSLVVTDVPDGRVQLQQHMPTGQEPLKQTWVLQQVS